MLNEHTVEIHMLTLPDNYLPTNDKQTSKQSNKGKYCFGENLWQNYLCKNVGKKRKTRAEQGLGPFYSIISLQGLGPLHSFRVGVNNSS